MKRKVYMICKNCGKIILSQASFCPKCGNYLEDDHSRQFANFDNNTDNMSPNTNRQRKNRKLVIFVAVIAALTVAVSMIVVIKSNSWMKSIEKMLDENNVSGAINIYVKKCKMPSMQNEFSNKLIEYEEKVFDEYNQGLITFEQADTKYDTVEDVASRLSLNLNVDTNEDRLQELNESKEVFEKGRQQLEQLKANPNPNGSGTSTFIDMISETIKCFNAVQNYDINYSEAQNLKDEAISLRKSVYNTLKPDLAGTYYPKVLEYWPQTYDYADYLLDIEDPTDDNKLRLKYYKKDGTVVYDKYIDYKSDGMFDHYASAEIDVPSALGTIDISIHVEKNEIVEISARRKGQTGGVSTQYEKQLTNSRNSDDVNDQKTNKNESIIGREYFCCGRIVGKGVVQDYSNGQYSEYEIAAISDEYLKKAMDYHTENGLKAQQTLDLISTAFGKPKTGCVDIYRSHVLVTTSGVNGYNYFKVSYLPNGSSWAQPMNVPCYELLACTDENFSESNTTGKVLDTNNNVIGSAN